MGLFAAKSKKKKGSAGPPAAGTGFDTKVQKLKEKQAQKAEAAGEDAPMRVCHSPDSEVGHRPVHEGGGGGFEEWLNSSWGGGYAVCVVPGFLMGQEMGDGWRKRER